MIAGTDMSAIPGSQREPASGSKPGNKTDVSSRPHSDVDSPFDPDQALVARCMDPDSDEFEAAFEAIYRRYRDRTYSVAYRVSGNATDAMDIVQEVFSLLFRKISGFRGESLFSTWLFRIVVNCAIDIKRENRAGIKRRTGSLDADHVPEPEDQELEGPAEAAQSGELGDHVHDCIQQLSPKLRAVLVLRYLEQMSYEELRETLGLSMGTVKSRLARAHIALHAVLEGTLEPFGYRQTPDGLYVVDDLLGYGPSEGVA